ncbi:MAG TPA: hypothetical protein VFO54_08615 [Chryseosolibacter sp.]|nr:hypothetical protein [Chryseosolibacter sp.]
MNSQDLPPRKKKPGREEEDAAKKRSHSDKPDASQESNRQPAAPENPSREEVISNWTKPVTNQDEQDKITNAPDNDIPLADQ